MVSCGVSGCVPAEPYPPLSFLQSGPQRLRRAMILQSSFYLLNFLSHSKGAVQSTHPPSSQSLKDLADFSQGAEFTILVTKYRFANHSVSSRKGIWFHLSPFSAVRQIRKSLPGVRDGDVCIFGTFVHRKHQMFRPFLRERLYKSPEAGSGNLVQICGHIK
jgi:hypothetical protein